MAWAFSGWPARFIAIGQGELERDVLGIGRDVLLEPGDDLVFPLERGQDRGEQVVGLASSRLAFDELFDEGQRSGGIAGVEIRLGEEDEERGLFGIVDKTALEGLEGQLDLLRLEENPAESEISLGFVVAEESAEVRGHDPAIGFFVQGLDDLAEGVGRLVELERGFVEIPQLELRIQRPDGVPGQLSDS